MKQTTKREAAALLLGATLGLAGTLGTQMAKEELANWQKTARPQNSAIYMGTVQYSDSLASWTGALDKGGRRICGIAKDDESNNAYPGYDRDQRVDVECTTGKSGFLIKTTGNEFEEFRNYDADRKT